MHIDRDALISPAAFLEELKKSLNSDETIDAELAKIVSQHILSAAPAKDCVEQAMLAITELAATRATSPMENSDG